MQVQDILRDSLSAFLRGIGEFLPNILAALVIPIVGWIVAKAVKSLAVRGLKLVRVPALTEQGGIDAFLAKGAVTRDPGSHAWHRDRNNRIMSSSGGLHVRRS